jgi:hypothetical protein
MGVLRALSCQLMNVFGAAENSGTLQSTDNEQDLAEALLWILMCAGTVWLDQNDKHWFSRRIAAQVAYLRLRTWQHVEDILIRYLWIRGICPEKVGPLWFEVEMLGAATWIEEFGL